MKKHAALAALLLASAAAPRLAHAIAAPIDDGGGNCGCLSNEICQSQYYSYYQPGYVANAARGDGVLYQGPGVTAMLNIGFVFTHFGLMQDSYSVRHNTMTLDDLKNNIIKPSLVGGALTALFGSLYGKVKVDGWKLYRGSPGLISQALDGSAEFGSRAAVTLLKTSAYRQPHAAQVVAWEEGRSAFYSVHSYKNMWAAQYDGGMVCSTTAAVGSNNVWTDSWGVSTATVPAATVNLAASNLRTNLYNYVVRPAVNDAAPWTMGDGSRAEAAWGVTDQIVNCFLHYQSGGCWEINANYLWTNNGDAQTVAPDHIAFANTANASAKGAGSSPYRGNYGGAWNDATLQAPQYVGGGWVSGYYTYCVPSYNGYLQ